jgi:GxxExxY protein
MMEINDVSGQIIDAAMKVHKALGPGLLESAYEACLAYELRKRGLRVATQEPLPIVYEDVRLDVGYRMDLVVEGAIVVEIKSLEAIAPIHKAQLISYLKLSGHKIGLLINFNVELLKQGVTRLVNGL